MERSNFIDAGGLSEVPPKQKYCIQFKVKSYKFWKGCCKDGTNKLQNIGIIFNKINIAEYWRYSHSEFKISPKNYL